MRYKEFGPLSIPWPRSKMSPHAENDVSKHLYNKRMRKAPWIYPRDKSPSVKRSPPKAINLTASSKANLFRPSGHRNMAGNYFAWQKSRFVDVSTSDQVSLLPIYTNWLWSWAPIGRRNLQAGHQTPAEYLWVRFVHFCRCPSLWGDHTMAYLSQNAKCIQNALTFACVCGALQGVHHSSVSHQVALNEGSETKEVIGIRDWSPCIPPLGRWSPGEEFSKVRANASGF